MIRPLQITRAEHLEGYRFERSSLFKRDYKRIKRQGVYLNLNTLLDVIRQLAHKVPLDRRYLGRPLQGNWRGYRACHIEPDWLLIYKFEGDTLGLSRTGSHSTLFD